MLDVDGRLEVEPAFAVLDAVERRRLERIAPVLVRLLPRIRRTDVPDRAQLRPVLRGTASCLDLRHASLLRRCPLGTMTIPPWTRIFDSRLRCRSTVRLPAVTARAAARRRSLSRRSTQAPGRAPRPPSGLPGLECLSEHREGIAAQRRGIPSARPTPQRPSRRLGSGPDATAGDRPPRRSATAPAIARRRGRDSAESAARAGRPPRTVPARQGLCDQRRQHRRAEALEDLPLDEPPARPLPGRRRGARPARRSG